MAESAGQEPAQPPGSSVRRLLPLLLAVLVTSLNATVLFLVLPPLARQFGFAEAQVGLLLGVAALMHLVNAPLWGRRSERWGRKPVLLVGLLGYGTDFLLFALVAWLGLQGTITGTPLFITLLILRALSGVFASATMPAAQAYVADVTTPERRSAGIALVGAASGMAIVLGPALAALVSTVGVLVVPLVPGLAAALLAPIIWRRLPESRVRTDTTTRALSPLDARIAPFLLTYFGIGLGLAFMQSTIAFLLQDRLDLALGETTRSASLAFLAAGVVLVAVQVGVIPRLRPSPAALLRVGLPISAVAMVALAVAPSLPLVIGAVAILALGMGLAFPGAQAGPTLMVGRDEQGSLGGLSTSALVAAYVVGPAIGAVLYGLAPAAPYLAGALLFGALWIFVLAHPAIRSTVTLARGRSTTAEGATVGAEERMS